jgi:hypothetical protein
MVDRQSSNRQPQKTNPRLDPDTPLDGKRNRDRSRPRRRSAHASGQASWRPQLPATEVIPIQRREQPDLSPSQASPLAARCYFTLSRRMQRRS